MGDPLFSVVIPSHNYGHFLSTTIDSVLQQRRSDVEIIVVDDASTDDTPRLVMEYGNAVDYLRLERNVGAATAWAKGLDRARGRFICKLDADDWQLPGFFERAEAAFAVSEDIGMVVGSVFVFHEGSGEAHLERVSDSEHVLDAGAFRRRLLGQFFFRMPGVCIRRSALWGHRAPRADLRLPHDWEYFLRVMRGTTCALVPEAIAVYRVHGASLTSTSSLGSRLQRDLELFLALARDREDPAYLEDDERRYLARGAGEAYLGIVGPYLYPSKPLEAARHVWAAVRLAASESFVAAALVLKYALHGIRLRLSRKLGKGLNELVVPVDTLLPRARRDADDGPLRKDRRGQA